MVPVLMTALAMLVSLGRIVDAAGSRADYARAAGWGSRVGNKTLNERLQYTWVDAHTLVIRRQETLSTWRLVQVDARDGARSEAFDHEAIARKLGAKLGRELQADALPVHVVGREDKSLLVHADLRAFALEPEGAVREVDLASVPALELQPQQVYNSRDGGAKTVIVFANGSKQPVELIWLALDRTRKTYKTIAPGATHRQPTFSGHAWIVQGEDRQDLGRYVARERPGVVHISDMAITSAAAKQRDRQYWMSPDGRQHALIRDAQVWIRDQATRDERQLSDDGTPEDPYVRGGMSWSPDSRWLMVVREVPGEERMVHVIESSPKDQLQPKLHSFRYPKPGDRIARRRPRLFDIRTGRRVPIPDDSFAAPGSLTDFSWSPDGQRFRFLYRQRGRQVVRFIELDPAKGTACTLIEETSPTFVDYYKRVLRRLGSTDTWLWASERSGWNRLYVLDAAAGSLRPLTSGEWVVRSVVDVDTEAGTVDFVALGIHPGEDPYHRHYGRVSLADGKITWLTQGDGTHYLKASPDGEYYVDTWSRSDLPPVHELRRRDGTLVTALEKADIAPLLAAGWQIPERFQAKGRDGKTDIWGIIYKPSNFDPEIRYPVIEYIYASPHSQFVPKNFQVVPTGGGGLPALVELGFIVVQSDGMGTNWRSKAFHDVCWKNLGDSGFPDRIAWVRAAAAKRPWMDLDRVGIVGVSAGGQSALRALLAHGDFYDVAVADSGCHDNRMDKISWTEEWMGWPVGPHYAEQSNVTQAHRLQGKLMLLVGELDRNVDPASTMQVVDALIKADKDFDLIVIPGAGHAALRSPYAKRRMRDFFVRHLLGVEPRAN
ncbi:MAG: DPP IV N-terminal domain-containing protein [Planctomycetota bacterium]